MCVCRQLWLARATSIGMQMRSFASSMKVIVFGRPHGSSEKAASAVLLRTLPSCSESAKRANACLNVRLILPNLLTCMKIRNLLGYYILKKKSGQMNFSRPNRVRRMRWHRQKHDTMIILADFLFFSFVLLATR